MYLLLLLVKLVVVISFWRLEAMKSLLWWIFHS